MRSDKSSQLSFLARLPALLCALAIGAAASNPAAPARADEADALVAAALEPWTGDLDGIVARGALRIATAHSPFLLHYDGERMGGVVVELAALLEEALSQRFDRTVSVLLLPRPRDALLDAVLAGEADLVAANLTITPERAARVAFSDPLYDKAREIVITGPAAPGVTSFDDLVATGVHVRASSSYATHLAAMNAQRRLEGAAAIPVVDADERLEDHDLVEMVGAGLIPAVVVDAHKVPALTRIFPDAVAHEDLVVGDSGAIAWALRPDAPELAAFVNDFIAANRKGTLIGNVLAKRYYEEADWVEDVHSPEARARTAEVIEIIARYAETYGFEPLRIAAQGFQESGLDQKKRSKAGAVGVMQVLPSTAADPNVGVDDIHEIENNVHAGVKYLAFLRDRYFSDAEIAPLDRVLFTFAAYNAGPANIAKARKKATELGLDPNVWFENVEIAAARTISREPYVYVRNIYKYYVAFSLAGSQRAE